MKILLRITSGKKNPLPIMLLGSILKSFESNDISLIYGAVILFAVGNGLMWPSIVSILSKRAGATHQGAVQGIAGSFRSLASIIELTVGGFFYHFLGGAT